VHSDGWWTHILSERTTAVGYSGKRREALFVLSEMTRAERAEGKSEIESEWDLGKGSTDR
jgi:hypothetical protein